ncbi:Fe-S cluster assembly protein SufB [Candidatus Woesearchaeota archaeon]|nr:Fe-S cluster assembly protein SufB [Candidatus Woesearchaeota archaeon]
MSLNEALIRKISKLKNEPEWMLEKRLKGLKLFKKTKLPTWGPSLKELDFNKLNYYTDSNTPETSSWKKVPKKIKKTFDKLGIPEAEQKVLSGVGAQWDSNVIYHSIKESLVKQGIIFENMDTALKKYPELVKKYFMTIIPISEHKFTMLHAAVWSGGTFIYIPKNVKVDLPLQSYFRMNSQRGGQFEHTLIILDEGAELHYIEGCSSPNYTENSLHAGCVEIYQHPNSKMRYSSIENWSKNVYNLNTKRSLVKENAKIEWVTGNLGSKVAMVYPSSILIGENAKSESLGIAFANKNQNQDIGAKAIHLAPNTSSIIKSKSLSINGGISTYRGLVLISKNAKNSKSTVKCDALILDKKSVSKTYPTIKQENNESECTHEATVGKIGEEEIFYLMSRGLTEEQATHLIVNGFISPIVKALPLEYALELNKLIEMEIEE